MKRGDSVIYVGKSGRAFGVVADMMGSKVLITTATGEQEQIESSAILGTLSNKYLPTKSSAAAPPPPAAGPATPSSGPTGGGLLQRSMVAAWRARIGREQRKREQAEKRAHNTADKSADRAMKQRLAQEARQRKAMARIEATAKRQSASVDKRIERKARVQEREAKQQLKAQRKQEKLQSEYYPRMLRVAGSLGIKPADQIANIIQHFQQFQESANAFKPGFNSQGQFTPGGPNMKLSAQGSLGGGKAPPRGGGGGPIFGQILSRALGPIAALLGGL